MTAVSAHTYSVIPLLKIITHPPKKQKSVKCFHSGFAFFLIFFIYCWHYYPGSWKERGQRKACATKMIMLWSIKFFLFRQ